MLNLLNRYGITPKAFWVLGVQLMFLTSVALGQTVSGTVTDAETGETMPGVNVTVQGTQIGTATNADGEYSLNVPSLNASTLVFSFVGYESFIEPVNGRTTINVELTQEAVLGEDVIVVGYGTQRSQDVTGSVGVINNENIRSLSISSADQALVGQVAGVQINTTSGIPGGGPEVRVRGFASLGTEGAPLYVVDGYALPQNENVSVNPLADIAPSDIENITVLKDASASAIYGSRASNGVIVITTRSGQANTRQINVSASTGMGQEIERMKFDMSNAEQIAEFQSFIWTDRNGAGSPIPDVYQNPQNYADTDWFDLIRRNNATSYNANVSISGGDENIRSYFSAGYRNDQGIIHHTSFQRVNLRANIDATLSDQLSVGLNMAPSYTTRNLPDVTGAGRGSLIGQPMMMSPLGYAYFPDGHPLEGQLTQTSHDVVESPGMWNQTNPLFALRNLDQTFNGVRAIGNAFVTYTPNYVEGLSARASFNVDWGYQTEEEFEPSTLAPIDDPQDPEGEISTDRDTGISADVVLNYNRELGPGVLDATAGWEIRHEYSFGSSFDGEFPGDEIRTMNVATNIDGFSSESEWSMISYFGRASYNFDDRYIFTGSIRTDGSSRFGTNNRWGTFYTGAVAWNMHNDIELPDLFNELRLRASYGVSGNNQIGNYSALGEIDQQDYMFEGSVAAGQVIDNLPNPDLTWEQTKEWNLGVETQILDYRLGLTVEAYQRTSEDMLLGRQLPPSSGFGSVEANLGDMRNRGLEITLNSVNVETDDLTWSTDLTWSMYRNEILSLPNDAPIYYGGGENQPGQVSAVGQPIGMFLGYVVGYNDEYGDRLYTPAMIADPNVPKAPGTIAGNLIWEDTNGDGQIVPGAPEQNGDFGVIGNPHPDWSFGIVNTVNYQNWSLRIIMTGDINKDVNRREFFRTALNIDGLFNVAAEYTENFYRDENNRGSGHHPTPLGPSEARTRYRGEHSLNIYDATHLWVRNATLRYNLPAGFAGISSSNVYFSVDNPWIITSYPGNPQANDTQNGGNVGRIGNDFTRYPISTQFTLGVELSL